MKIALIQFAPEWENINKNIQALTLKIEALEREVDLIILPEMFSTGFSMNPQNIAEPENGQTVQWMIDTAKAKNVAVAGSLVIVENSKYYNRLFFIFPNGSYQTYDKKHLFSLAGEEKVYEAGHDKLIVNYKGWKICPLICYDLRFPVFSRITKNNYDLLIYVASWPDQRIHAWNSLLKARAIENMCFVFGVNRCGVDPFENKFSGNSQGLDFFGKYICKPIISEQIIYVVLNKADLNNARNNFAFLDDADPFELVKKK